MIGTVLQVACLFVAHNNTHTSVLSSDIFERGQTGTYAVCLSVISFVTAIETVCTDRLPKPKQIWRGSLSGADPSVGRYLSGRKHSGFLYTSGSRVMALRCSMSGLQRCTIINTPDVGQDGCTLRDEVFTIYIVSHDPVRHPFVHWSVVHCARDRLIDLGE